MSSSEKSIEDKIKAHVNNLPSSEGNFIIKLHGNSYMPTALPDLIGAYYGKPFAIEVKTDTGRLTPKQKLWLAIFKSGGYNTGVARSLDDAIRIMTNETTRKP